VGTEEKKIRACPSCHTPVWAVGLEGEIVTCKECGLEFKLSFEAAGDEEEPPQKDAVVQAVEEPTDERERDGREESPKGIKEEEVADKAFGLRVSEDKLEVHIYPRGEVPDEISLGDIKGLLEMKGIKHGIVDDKVITEYLKNRPIQKEPWKIAEGKAPEPARDAEVKYYFDTDTSKIGTLKEGGSIDFKDRGETPHVKKGDVIAEKILGMDGTVGMDVFGLTFPAQKPKDIKLRCGKGAERSEDGLEVLAKLDGRPEISADGKLFVLPELEISGDVDLETGNIDFDGNIEVHGAVQDGFSVRGGRLSAEAILKAEIDIAGDVVVSGGIIGANIKTSGNIRAKHVNGADINARGDVVVENELVNSNIESSGACLVKAGNILSSSISAKKGIEANAIGSATSNPCTLFVGLDDRTRNEIDRIKEQITLKREGQGKYPSRIDELQKECESLDKEIGRLAGVQDRAVQAQRALKQKMEELEKANNSEQLAQAQKLLKVLDSTISQNEKNLKPRFDKRDQIAKELAGFQDEIKDSEEEIMELIDEIESLSEWSRQEKGLTVVKVYDTVFSHTMIRGLHALSVLKETMHQVAFREIKTTDPDSGVVQWKIRFSQLD
jgi:uncharacterized protein (DUF342 family)